MRVVTVIIFTISLLSTSCHKNDLPEYYFKCKLNGETYVPNGCANCRECFLLGDTTLLLEANRGFEALGMGIIKLDQIPITPTTYLLNGNPQQGADYKYSTTTYDIYRTDSTHTGELLITMLDKTSKIIQGRFYFKAYNAYRNDSVTITQGMFRLKYTDY